MKKILLFLLLFLYCAPVKAQNTTSVTSQHEYNKSIIYIFYNNSNCKDCSKAISMFEELYNKYYKNKYDLYKINYQTEHLSNEYTKTYNLYKPLEIVLAKVENGQGQGYQKLDNLQFMTANRQQFERTVRSQIKNFLEKQDLIY